MEIIDTGKTCIPVTKDLKEYVDSLEKENKQLKEESDKYKHFIKITKENLKLIEEDKIGVNLLSLPKVLLKKIEKLEKGEENE